MTDEQEAKWIQRAVNIIFGYGVFGVVYHTLYITFRILKWIF